MPVSAYSTSRISEAQLRDVVTELGGVKDSLGWTIERDGAKVALEYASDTLDVHPDGLLRDITTSLGAVPRSRIALFYWATEKQGDAELLLRAVALAFAERWPIVLCDQVGNCEYVEPPRQF